MPKNDTRNRKNKYHINKINFLINDKNTIFLKLFKNIINEIYIYLD